MAELEVPDDAWDAFRLELAEHHSIHDADCVRAIAGPVIIAELRRLAETYQALGRDAGQQDGADYRSIAADLFQRADKLEAK